MRLIILRHAESEGNKTKIVQGQIETGLTEKGKNQAKALAEALKNEKIDIIFCSTMKRARQTFEEIIKYHSGANIFFDKRLVEMHFGKFQGGPREPLHKALEEFTGKYEDFKADGGESFNDIILRSKSFLDELETYKNKTVLVVSHGRIVRAMISLLLKKPLKDVMNSWIENATITEFEIKNGKAELKKIGENKHLEIV